MAREKGKTSRMPKRDEQATALAKFHDPRSYVANWNHQGTDHPCIYLKGREDKGAQREAIFRRDKFRCQACGRLLSLDGELAPVGEWHHKKGGLGRQRCDCIENAELRCPPWLGDCHSGEHVQVQWTKKEISNV